MRHIEQGSNARRMTTVAMTFALAPALVSPASGQRFGRRFPERVQESGWSSQRVTSNRGTFSVILDEDRHHKLKKARQHLANGKYEAAIEYLLDVLNSAPSAVYGRGVGSFHGLRRAAREELAKLNEEGRKVYHRLTRTEARPRLEQGLVERDAGGLSLVARLYPHTRAGTRAGLAAGDLFLERGRVLRALREFSFLRNGETGHAVKSRVNLCRALLGLPVTDADLEPGLPLLDGQRTASDWRRLITKLRGLGHDASGYDEDFWPSFGGGMEGNRFASTPADPFKWESRNQIHVPSRVKQSLHAVSNGRKVFIATGTSLYAYDLLTHRTPTWFVESSVLDQSDDFLSATNESMVHSPALGRDLVVAPLQVPLVTDTASRRAVFNGIPIIVPLPVRRLFTFEAETGRLKWSHWEEAGALPGDLSGVPLDVSGPPLVVGDTIFIATHKQLGTIAFYVSAFDLETGAHRWSSLLLSSQIEVNMFGNAHAEFAASPLAYSNGRVYGCTNLGATFSVRADDGSIEWLQSYPIIRIPRARMLPQDRPVYWANNAPVISDGVLVVTPLDSRHAQAHDLRSGKILWSAPFTVNDRQRPSAEGHPWIRWVLGVSGGNVYFSGHCIATVPIRGSGPLREVSPAMLVAPQRAGFFDLGYPRRVPRGLMTKDRIYLPSSEHGLLVFDHSGNLKQEPRGDPGLSMIGNLCASRGVLIAVSTPASGARRIDWFFSHKSLLTRARGRATSKPRDPRAQITLGELLSSQPVESLRDLVDARRAFTRAIELLGKKGAGPGSSLTVRARFGLFESYRKSSRLLRQQNPRAALAALERALDLGEELLGIHPIRESLLRLYVEALERYPAEREFRAAILSRLEKRHRDVKHFVPRLGKIKMGLFVQLVRLKDLGPRDSARKRLDIYRRILVDYGKDEIETKSGRSFALEGISRLLSKYGRKVYEPYEKEAEQLLARSSDDEGRLRFILDRYPLSAAALDALTALARAAAKSGNLVQALDAMRLARDRLPVLPERILPAVAEAAKRAGNHVLHGFLSGLDAARAPDYLPLKARLRGTPEVLLSTLSLGASSYKTFPVRHIPNGSPGSSMAEHPILILWEDDRSLVGLAPGSTGNGKAVFEVDFRMSLNPLRAVRFGRVLILPEPARVRGISIEDGRELWSYQAPAEQRLFLADALASGLYLFVTGREDSDTAPLETRALEPMTGHLVFERRDPKPGAGTMPTLRAGRAFRVDRSKTGSRLVVLDELTGRDRLELPLDGRVCPLIEGGDTRGVLVTGREILIRAESMNGRQAAGLYSLSLDGRRNWEYLHRGIGSNDNFIVSGEDVFLTVGFERARSAGRVVQLDRRSGNKKRMVDCGKRAFLVDYRDGTPTPRLSGPGPLLFIGQSRRKRALATLLDNRTGASSWSRELRWPRHNLAIWLARGCPLYGENVVVLAREKPDSSGRQGTYQFELAPLELRTGQRKVDALQGWRDMPGKTSLAVLDGRLVVHSGRGRIQIFGESPAQTGK